ncbi:MAG: S9 family peptidase [Planctomycetota bacterium]
MSKKPLTARAMWKLPRVGAPVPSPDGARSLVSVTTYDLETNDATTRLWLVPTDGGEARPLTTSDASSGRPAWSPDGARILFTRKPAGDDAVPQVWLMHVDGGEPERITDVPLGAADPKWFPDGERIAFCSDVYRAAPTLAKTEDEKEKRDDEPVKAHVTENRFFRFWDKWLTDEKFRHVFAMDLGERKPVDLTPEMFVPFGLMDATGLFEIAPDGREIALSGIKTEPPYDEATSGVFTIALPAKPGKGMKTPKITEITGHLETNAFGPVYSPDGKALVYGVQREKHFYGDRIRLISRDRKSGREKLLTEHWDRSPAAWRFSADSRTLWILAEDEGRVGLYEFDLPAARRAPRKCPPLRVLRGGTLAGLEIAGGRVFTSRNSLREPPEAFVLDEGEKRLRRLTTFTKAGMKHVALSPVKDIRFEGADEEKVQMFVLLPPGTKWPKPGQRWTKRPLVHMIHGGPHSVFGDQWHWRWNAQAVAAPGYVVALVNFHGSSSFGNDFTKSILGQWGDQPFEDIERASDELIDRKLVDENRMAVTGGSYGGYLVSWIAAQTDRYACIVNHAGVCDFQTQFASDMTYGRARSMGGEPWDNLPGMDLYNPMRYAAGFSSPMLVIHGEKDYRVPYAQGLEIYGVYKAMGLPARLVVFPDENHWILKPRNSLLWYEEFTGWLKRWLGKRK